MMQLPVGETKDVLSIVNQTVSYESCTGTGTASGLACGLSVYIVIDPAQYAPDI